MPERRSRSTGDLMRKLAALHAEADLLAYAKPSTAETVAQRDELKRQIEQLTEKLL
jgi:predicted site-specific integrase-resolvase